MKKYSKYKWCTILVLATYFLSQPLIFLLSRAPDGTSDELSFIVVGITLILAVMVGCTTLIIFTIKENNQK